MTETLESLNKLVEYHVPENPAGQCRLAVDELGRTLNQYNISYEPVEGSFRGSRLGGSGESVHWFIRIPSSEIANYERDCEIIVDPTVRQFTEELYKSGKSLSFIPSEKLPSEYVVTPNDAVYNAYDDRSW